MLKSFSGTGKLVLQAALTGCNSFHRLHACIIFWLLMLCVSQDLFRLFVCLFNLTSLSIRSHQTVNQAKLSRVKAFFLLSFLAFLMAGLAEIAVFILTFLACLVSMAFHQGGSNSRVSVGWSGTHALGFFLGCLAVAPIPPSLRWILSFRKLYGLWVASFQFVVDQRNAY